MLHLQNDGRSGPWEKRGMVDELMRFMLVGPASQLTEVSRTHLAAPAAIVAEGSGEFTDPETELERLRVYASDADLVADVKSLVFSTQLDNLRGQIGLAPDPKGALSSLVEKAIGGKPEEVVGRPEWLKAKTNLNDSMVAAKLVGAKTAPLRDLASRLATMHVVDHAAKHCQATIDEGRRILDGGFLLPERYGRPTTRATDPARTQARRSRIKTNVVDAATLLARRLSTLRTRLDAVDRALHELCDVDRSDIDTLCPDGSPVPGEEDRDALCRTWELISRGEVTPGVVANVLRQVGPPARLFLNKRRASALSEDTRKVLLSLEVDASSTDLVSVSKKLTDERRQVQIAYEAEAPRPLQKSTGLVGGALVTHLNARGSDEKYAAMLPNAPDDIHEALHPHWPGILGQFMIPPGFWDDPPPGGSRLRPVGKGRLYIVRHQLLRYEPGEVSHIENILVGEKRDRTHIRRTRLEQFTATERETEREEERSLETTDRAEIEREVENTIREQFDAKGGVKVTGSYGMVSFEASAEIGYSRTSEERSRSAQKLARSVTETAKNRVKERIFERRERRLIEEVEEVNSHGFDGTSYTNHRSGVYQWLTKVYQAEVWDYGERTMYDLLVPEPAAGLIHAATESPTSTAGLPQHPGEIPYGIDALDERKVHELVARFGVTEQIAPYPQDRIVSISFDATSDKDSHASHFAQTKRLTIPDLYYPSNGWLRFKGRRDQEGAGAPVNIGVTIGPLEAHFALDNVGANNAGGNRILLFPFPASPGGSVPAGESLDCGVAVDDFSAFVVTITILMRPNPQAFAKWRRDAFAAIQAAHAQRLQEWRDAQTVERFDSSPGGDVLFGRNPERNREIEKVELQRAAIEIMRNRPADWIHMRDGLPSVLGAPPFLPTIDLAALREEAPEIRFLQQAFEWENLTFVLYPYFYGRPTSWSLKLFYRDADPRFVEFLQSGAARVQLPVRPGFEAAVDHYMMTGVPWLGKDEPTIGDDAFLSLYEETRARMGANEPERHLEEEDFTFEVPTSLIKVRPDDTLPRWEKVEGEWREATPPADD